MTLAENSAENLKVKKKNRCNNGPAAPPNKIKRKTPPPPLGEGYSAMLHRGGSTLAENPLPLFIALLTEKVPLSSAPSTLNCKLCLFHYQAPDSNYYRHFTQFDAVMSVIKCLGLNYFKEEDGKIAKLFFGY